MNSPEDTELFLKPPVDAWGALYEHLDREVADGRETEDSSKALIKSAYLTDLGVTTYRLLNLKPLSWIDDLVAEVAKLVVREAVEEICRDNQKNKAPFWAKKWRGQR